MELDKKKAFALNAIRPYAKDPSLCGVDLRGRCVNFTEDGRMCVAGKYLLPEVRNREKYGVISSILRAYGYDQSKVFIPEAVDILNTDEWAKLQAIHDALAGNQKFVGILQARIDSLGLFTYEEMMAD